MGIEVKKLDRHGRLVIPKEWRERHGDEVVVVTFEDRIEILPRKGNIIQFADSVEVEELKEWEELKRELHEVRGL